MAAASPACLEYITRREREGPLSGPVSTHHHPLPVSYMADTIRSHFRVLGIAGETNIHHLKR
jgi:hypothetical protein